MGACADVAVFAGDAGFCGGEVELVVDDGAGGVATEADFCLFIADRAADGFFEVLGMPEIVARW